ncbi:STE like transcription factor-domain-containing protein [Obelidium mucronatum]|nr:STE like transcription factor-domain-containing protein [Obelidium mucronatum]
MAPKRRATRQRPSDADSASLSEEEAYEAPPAIRITRDNSPAGAGLGDHPPLLDQHDAGGDIGQALEKLKLFLVTAPSAWQPGQVIKRLKLPSNETIACILWNNLYHITGTDIVKALQFRFAAFGRPVKIQKKFEEGIFSDLRNLKPGVDATLEEPRSPLLDFLFKANCIRTQKKQKVFYWFSVPHDRLFLDALERDLKREAQGLEPTTMPSAMSADVTLTLAKQQCLPTFAVDASNPGTPAVFSRQESAHSGMGGDMHQQQFGNSSIEQELFQQAFSAAASQHNSPFMESINPFQNQQLQQASYHSSPHMQNTRLSPLTMTNHFVNPSASYSEPQYQQHQQFANPESPTKRARLEVPSRGSTSSPQHRPLKITAPMGLIEGSPNYKQRSRNRVHQSPNTTALVTQESMNPDMFRSKTDRRHFTCTADNCGQNFKRFEHLRRHYRLHTGEKPYVCQVVGCEKSFARADGLTSHLKTHGLSLSEIQSAVRKQQDAAGDEAGPAGGSASGAEDEGGDVPELVTEGPGESPLALLTPLSMAIHTGQMMNHQHTHQQQQQHQGLMFQLQNPMHHPNIAYQQQMDQFSVQATNDMMQQQQQQQQQQQRVGEEFSTFFNIGEESPTSLNLPDASAFLPDAHKTQPFFNFQVPSQGNLQYSMNHMQNQYHFDTGSNGVQY